MDKTATRPRISATTIIPFDEKSDAFKMVPAIFHGGVIPLAIEYVERGSAERAARELELKWPYKGDNTG